MPLTEPCSFCKHKLSKIVGDFSKVEPQSNILDFAYELYRGLFCRFGFNFDLPEEYNVVRDNTYYTNEIEESIWGLSYVYRTYYKYRFNGLFPSLFKSQERYCFYIKTFAKVLFREHVCAFKFLVFCGFLSELTSFFHRRAAENALSLAPKQLQAIFDETISTEFYNKGGWDYLQKTAQLLSDGYKKLQDIIDFDPEIENYFFNREEVMDAIDYFCQNCSGIKSRVQSVEPSLTFQDMENSENPNQKFKQQN